MWAAGAGAPGRQQRDIDVGLQNTVEVSAGLFRRPEPIESAVGAIAVAFLGLGWLAIHARGDLFLDHVVILVTFVVAVLCVVAGAFLSRGHHRSAILTLHCITTVFAALVIRGAGRTTDVLLLVLLELHLALRLPLPWAAVGQAVTIFVFATLTLSIHGGALDRLEVLAVGVVTAILADVVFFYRERLVQSHARAAVQSQSLENLAAANQSFVAHLERVETAAAERERLLITRELHDCVGYAMTSITMMMNAVPYIKHENLEKLIEYCAKTKELASTTLQETRQILYRLRSIASQGTPSPTLFFTRLCRDFEEATGVRTECHVGNLPTSMPEAVFNTLFRAVQVGFINAVRHGNTGHITLSFWMTEPDLQMSIWNNVPNGVILTPESGEGIGLRGIRERLDVLNGSMSFGPLAHGYQLIVTIPGEELTVDAD